LRLLSAVVDRRIAISCPAATVDVEALGRAAEHQVVEDVELRLDADLL
jgi:hypothetical protein